MQSFTLFKNFCKLTSLLLLIGFSTNSPAAEKTPFNKQPVEIQADSLIAQELKGSSNYRGNVHVKQGDFELFGENVLINHPNNELSDLIATGKPAKFKRFNAEENSWVNGEAEAIFYDAKQKIVTLTGSAIVKQDNKHTITGPKLVYDLTNHQLEAQGNPDKQERISVTLSPNQEENQ